MLPDLSVLPLPLLTSEWRATPTAADAPHVVDPLSAARGCLVSALADVSADRGTNPRIDGIDDIQGPGRARYRVADALLCLALSYGAAGAFADGMAYCGLAAALMRDAAAAGAGSAGGMHPDGLSGAASADDAGYETVAKRADCLRACLMAEAERFEEAIDLFANVMTPSSDAVERADRGEGVEALRWRVEAGIGAALCLATLGRGLEARRTLDAVMSSLQDWVATAQDHAVASDARRAMVRFAFAQVRALLALHQPMDALGALAQVDAMGAAEDPQTALLRAAAYLSLGRPMQAVAPLDAVLAVRADDPAALVLYGQAMAGLGEYAFAVDRFDAALRAMPRFAPAYRYMASALAMQKSDDAALACLRAARDIRPDFPEVWLDEAGIRLRRGELRRGFAAYEQRDGARLAARRSDQYWNGDDTLAGRSLLVVAEQGLGDTVQFLRYIPLVRALAREVVVEVQPPLWRLAAERAQAWGVRVIPRGSPLPACDRFTMLMSLPYALQTTMATIPAGAPYLFAAPALRLALPDQALDIDAARDDGIEHDSATRSRHGDAVPRGSSAGLDTGQTAPLRIGLVVSGNPAYRNDALRSMPLSACAPLFELADVECVMLQPTLRDADHQWIDAQRAAGKAPNWRPGLIDMAQGDFADTAGVIESLDIVISVDTAIAHLSGALGKPVWIMLPYVADWRWLSDRSDSPWYPSARLFRQQAMQDWTTVISEIGAALAQRVANQTF